MLENLDHNSSEQAFVELHFVALSTGYNLPRDVAWSLATLTEFEQPVHSADKSFSTSNNYPEYCIGQTKFHARKLRSQFLRAGIR
jgi:hypothetical protein